MKVKANGKDAKEVVIAKVTMRQAIVVAAITFVSAVAVAFITNLDKVTGPKSADSEEVGYYEGRASIVEHAFQEREEALQAESELAQQSGKSEEAIQLRALADETRKSRDEFRELHSKHTEAIKMGERLKASQIKTEANEKITKINGRVLEVFLESELQPVKRVIREKQEAELIALASKNGYNLAIHHLIPLYGKRGATQNQEELCELQKTPPLLVDKAE